jgi:ABC-type bacteriocin transporter
LSRKYTCIKQHDIKDCGAACIAMICKHYGLQVPLSKIREMAGTDLQGTTAYGLIQAAGKLGFSAKALKANPAYLFELTTLPTIAHLVLPRSVEHYVVIHHISAQQIIVADPVEGMTTYTPEQFLAMWTGVLIVMHPTEKFRPGNEKKGLLLRFLRLLYPERKWWIGVFATSLIITGLGILAAFYFRILLDHMIPNSFTQSLHIVSIGMIFLIMCKVVLQAFRSHLLVYVSQALDKSLILGYYQHVVRLPMNFFSTRQTGEVISRLQDASKVRDALSSASLTMMIDTLMMIAGGIILYSQNARLFVLALAIVPVYIWIVYQFHKPYEQRNRDHLESNEKLISYIVESINGIETIKSYHAEMQTTAKAETKFNRLLHSVRQLANTLILQTSCKTFIQATGGIVILWAGAHQVIHGQMSVGQLITFNALLVYFLDPLQNLIQLQPQIQTAIVAADRLAEVLDLEHENTMEALPTPHVEPLSLRGDIEINNLLFRYGARATILKHIHMRVAHNEKIAFVGGSGSGKSTLVKLLMNFYQAEQGDITINQQPISNIPLHVLRRKIAYVSQEQFFFYGTIHENLCIGADEPVPLERIIEVAKQVHIHTYIESLPGGYETLLEENGSNLSGGQKQRLAIVRAILRNPDILILDEATSQLDTTTEHAISQTIMQLEGITTMIIAHRLSTIMRCDRIYVMEQGQIIESGTHHELMLSQGKYVELWKNQIPESYTMLRESDIA